MDFARLWPLHKWYRSESNCFPLYSLAVSIKHPSRDLKKVSKGQMSAETRRRFFQCIHGNERAHKKVLCFSPLRQELKFFDMLKSKRLERHSSHSGRNFMQHLVQFSYQKEGYLCLQWITCWRNLHFWLEGFLDSFTQIWGIFYLSHHETCLLL